MNRMNQKTSWAILLEPRKLVIPEELSPKTLQMMDKAIKNYKAGTVSEAIDLSEF